MFCLQYNKPVFSIVYNLPKKQLRLIFMPDFSKNHNKINILSIRELWKVYKSVIILLEMKKKELPFSGSKLLNIIWRRHPDLNRRITVLQTAALATWLCRHKKWSGRTDLNRRRLPWQGSTLPLSYARSLNRKVTILKRTLLSIKKCKTACR